MSITIEQDLKEVLGEINQKLGHLQDDIDQRFDRIQVDIDQRFDRIQGDIDQKFDRIQGDVTDLKVGQARLEEKVDGLGRRIDNQEFISRGVLIGLLVAVLGGLAKVFGFVGTS
jgi:chromosome segregation ATPase